MTTPKLSVPQIEVAKGLLADGRKASAETLADAITPRNAMGLPDRDWHRLIIAWLQDLAQENISFIVSSSEAAIEHQVLAWFPDKGVVVHIQDRETGEYTSNRRATKAELVTERERARARLRAELPQLHPLRSPVLTELTLAVAVEADPKGLVPTVIGQVVGPESIKSWQLKEIHHRHDLEPARPKAAIAREVAAEGKGLGYSEGSLQTFLSRPKEDPTSKKKPAPKKKKSTTVDPSSWVRKS